MRPGHAAAFGWRNRAGSFSSRRPSHALEQHQIQAEASSQRNQIAPATGAKHDRRGAHAGRRRGGRATYGSFRRLRRPCGGRLWQQGDRRRWRHYGCDDPPARQSRQRRHHDGRPSGGTGGNDRPHKPRFPKYPIIPKHPIIVGIPTGVTAVTATGSSLSATGSSVSASGGGRPPSRARVLARTGSGSPPANERRYRPDEVLTQFASGVSNETIDALGRRLRLDRVAFFISNGATISRWKIPDQRAVPAVVRALEAERIVLAAQPNYLYELQQQSAASSEPEPALVGEGDPGQSAWLSFGCVRPIISPRVR